MKTDAYKLSRACYHCQRYANSISNSVIELKLIVIPWPFAVWGIDLIGELPKGKGGVKYVMVDVDYFTKWVEAEPLATITAGKLKEFVCRAIICRFGIPFKLISDSGKQFDSKEMKSLCEEL